MAWDHALKMQTPHNIYPFMASFSAKYAIYVYSGDGSYKSEWGGGGLSLLATEHRRGNTSCKKQEEEQEADHSNPLWIVSYSTFSRHKICCASSVQSTSQIQAEVAILWLRKEPLCYYVFPPT